MNTITNTIKCEKLSSFNGTAVFNPQTGQLEMNKMAVEIRKEK
nr:MAG TPA: hypothetical protein [Caudoviricetes sp.]DAR96578.1 MAG TPA: hypothetical protein [Caudoviricetes sp.]